MGPPVTRGGRLPTRAPTLSRPVAIVADDYGIGPETSRGILEMAGEGRITAAVLIVNAPDAERAALAWRAANPPADLGWHPNLTLDRPVLKPEEVPSLVRADGTFWHLGRFLRQVALGRIRASDVRAEWQAQYGRFVDLTGIQPAVVNSHQHVSLFPPCDLALLDILAEAAVRPHLRQVIEPARTLARVPGARVKRALLSALGHRVARRAAARGIFGCDWLAGVTAPRWVTDPLFWERWLGRLPPTGSVEVCCHPGHHDITLVGRDCDAGSGVRRRPLELNLLRAESFRTACQRAGLVPMRPTDLHKSRSA